MVLYATMLYSFGVEEEGSFKKESLLGTSG
jgi:hypothetical protein